MTPVSPLFAQRTHSESIVPTADNSTSIGLHTIETDPDTALLSRVAGGDRAAFARLYQRFSTKAYRIVHGIIRDPDQAEEVTQEVFLAIWRHASQYDPARGSIANYIAMLAHAKAVDRVRSSQASRTRDEKYSTKNILRTEHHDPVSERALLREEHSRIRLALADLTPFQREAIKLHYFERRTYEETGRLLGVSVVAVKARVRSGVVQLRIMMMADK